MFATRLLFRPLTSSVQPLAALNPGVMRAVQISEPCTAADLKVSQVQIPVPNPGEVLVKNRITGLNFIDTYHRSGLYPREYPCILGVEGAGSVSAVGANVDDSLLGCRVGYYGTGTYAEYTSVPVAQTFTLPETINLAEATSTATQGLTAHYLTTSTFPLAPGHTCLIHAGAGGTGHILVQMAKIHGATVIATASTAEKLQFATENGADFVVNYKEESNWAAKVRELTGGTGVDVVYDGVGKTTWEGTLNSLKKRGMAVYFGNASGTVPPIDPLLLTQKGSLFVTRPKLYDYLDSREELQQRCDDVFKWIQDGKLKYRFDASFPLSDAAKAHEYIENGHTAGKVMIEI